MSIFNCVFTISLLREEEEQEREKEVTFNARARSVNKTDGARIPIPKKQKRYRNFNGTTSPLTGHKNSRKISRTNEINSPSSSLDVVLLCSNSSSINSNLTWKSPAKPLMVLVSAAAAKKLTFELQKLIFTQQTTTRNRQEFQKLLKQPSGFYLLIIIFFSF